MNMKHLIISAMLASASALLTTAAVAVPPATFTVEYTRAGDISQKNFTVAVGQKVRLQVNPKESGSGCMSDIMIRGLVDKPQALVKGKPVVMEFTPYRPGSYPITCSMGVDRGRVTVN